MSGKTTEILEVTKQVDGSVLGIPVVNVTGKSSGPTLLLIGGIHGDEPEGIQAVIDVMGKLNPDQVRGTVIGVPVVNVPAMVAQKRGNHLDDWFYDINRLFPGSSKGSLTQRFANKLMTEIVAKGDILIALHSGGNNIYCCKRSIIPNDSEVQVRLAKALGPGWEFVARGAGERKQISDLSSIAAQEKEKVSITMEHGGVCDRLPGRFDEIVEAFVSAVYNVMKEYKMIDGKPAYGKELIMMEYEPIRNNHGGIVKCTESFRPGKEVKGGEELLRITDYFGNTLEVIKAPYDGILIAVPAAIVLPSGGCQLGSIGKVTKRVKN